MTIDLLITNSVSSHTLKWLWL